MNAMRVVTGAVLVAVALGVSGCGASDDAGDEVFATTAAPSTSDEATGTAVSATSTPDDDIAADDTKARWVGTAWSSTVGESSGTPVVDGAPISLTSVVGMCTDPECTFSLDLLTESDVDGLPPPGPYVIWASRFTDRTDDGRANWMITDALDVELTEDQTTYVCNPTSDPAVQVLGLGAITPPDVESITPASVWTVDADGAIVSPDPSGYTCDSGGF